MNIKQGTILAFGEIFLKSKGVQKELKRKLTQNLSLLLRKEKVDFKIINFHQRIFIETNNNVLKILKGLFGISWFANCFFLEKASFKEVNDFIRDNYPKWVHKGETFALRIRKEEGIRQDREEMIEKIARNIERKVNLDKPKREIFIEVKEQGWFIYLKKTKGPDGLPVGCQGKVISLISGGIDSPVSSYLIAKRGAENIWVHFHSFPLVSRASIEKVEELAKTFIKFQPRLKVYFVPFSDIQKEAKMKIPPKYLVLIYRRLMLKISQKIAVKERCSALVTGESLGQVSSQTLFNLQITGHGLLVLRPLIGLNKEEIISLAKKIKSFNISIKPQEDCCTLFVPKHQTAKGRSEIIKEMEKKISSKLISKALQEAEVKQYGS